MDYLGFTFCGKLDAAKFTTEMRLRRACNMLGGALLKQFGSAIDGQPSVLACREDSTITVICAFRNADPEDASRVKKYLESVVGVINSIDTRDLDRV